MMMYCMTMGALAAVATYMAGVGPNDKVLPWKKEGTNVHNT